MPTIRPPGVAGTFYPRDARTLQRAVAGHLATVPVAKTVPGARPPKLLLVPHAGYVYSGDVAALAYAPLAPWRGQIRRVVLLGPVHRVAVRGLAAPTVDAFETPLGRVAIDRAALDSLRSLRQVVWSDEPHAQEHSLEVQLPFLQTVLGAGFTLVPLAVGKATPSEVAEVLERLWGGDETLVVVSSDLSHYLPYAQAQARDRATVERILNFATDLRGEEACGAAPLNGALQVARERGLAASLLGVRNSADAPGMARTDRDRVVGYGAFAFDPAPGPGPVSGEDGDNAVALGRALVATARRSIADALGLTVPPAEPAADHPALYRPGASFVTLHGADGQLRGCVGHLEAVRLLRDDVYANARAAAFHDSRFEALRANEWPGLSIEISVLDPAEPLAAASEADARAALRPGVDGVILEWRGRRATFLPQVWQQLPDGGDFIAALKRKAGLAADFWSAELRLSRYRVRSFGDAEPTGRLS